MMILIVGEPDSGKSKRAEELVLELSENKKRIYLATMIPFGEDGEKRIEKHRKLRQGKDFVTVERPVDLRGLETKDFPGIDASVLLECVSNLVGNEMHVEGRENWSSAEVSDYVVDEILWLRDRASELVVVTNEFQLQDDFDEDTKKYVEITKLVNEKLKRAADRTEIVGAGLLITG